MLQCHGFDIQQITVDVYCGFLDYMLSSFVGGYQHFKGTCFIYYEDSNHVP